MSIHKRVTIELATLRPTKNVELEDLVLKEEVH